MQMTPRRAERIRNEMRQWLRSHLGVRTQYSKAEIDSGREDLGFSSVEDALFAYTLFGGDLMPGFAESLNLSISPEDIHDLIEAACDGLFDATGVLDCD